MKTELRLNDISDHLLILEKTTVETLFQLENCADCIALYMFYYKTAKWQGTNTVQANDLYVKKSLKWGVDKIRRTKQTLKEHGLIDIVQRRKDGKISGWFIEIKYLVAKRKIEDVKIIVDNEDGMSKSNNTQNQQVAKATGRFEDTNALKINNKCLKNKIKLEERKKEEKSKKQTTYDEIIDKRVFDNDLKQALYEFIRMRKLMRKPMTDRALEMLITRVYNLGITPDEQVAIVWQSVRNSWSDVYPLKTDKQFKNEVKNGSKQKSEYEENYAKQLEQWEEEGNV